MTALSSDAAARGLAVMLAKATSRPHGTRGRYVSGCRCDDCRGANRDYVASRTEARARGEFNGIVSAENARRHLAWLSERGVGYKTAADVALVSRSTVAAILRGSRTHLRAMAEKRILAVTEMAAADGAYIDARATWKLLNELLASGYTKRRLASEIAGRPTNALQLRPDQVSVRNAELVRRAYARLRYAPPAAQRRAQVLLQELREEGFRLEQIRARLATLAAARGWPAPELGDRLRQQEVDLLQIVHAALLSEELTA